MKIVFFGSDDFANTNLEALIRSRHNIVGCVTQTDKAKGRHLKVAPPLVKTTALEAGIDVLQPENLNDIEAVDALKKYQADIFVVIAYGKFLPVEILKIPKLFCINVHGSLLPKYRGAAPINRAIVNGDTNTGISIIKMNEAMDAGDIVSKKELPIEKQDIAKTLREKMAKLSSELLVETLECIEKDEYKLIAQDQSQVTYAPRLKKEEGQINWSEDAIVIHNKIRGFQPWPGSFTQYNNKVLKILDAHLIDFESSKASAGEVIQILDEGFSVAAGKGALLIKKVHLESAKPMDAKDFISGHKLPVGFLLR